MLKIFKICLTFSKSEPTYAYKRYAYKKKHVGFAKTLKKHKVAKIREN